MVKLSVVVPFYNVQTYAPETLRSLRANARGDFEFLLVDDCSTDGTSEVLERLAPGVPGAVLLKHERNSGVSTARNTGIAAARGEYLAFLDGDDWVAPGYYADLVAAIDGLGCDFVRTDHMQFTGSVRTLHRVPVARRGEVLRPRDSIGPAERSTSVDYPFPCTGIFHRRLIDRGLMSFRDDLRTAEDRAWLWRMHLEAESFGAVGLNGIFYRRGVTSSLTQVGDDRQFDFIKAYDYILDMTSRDREADRFLPKAIRTYCALIAFHMNSDRFTPAMASKLRGLSAGALQRMPQDTLDAVVDGMDEKRAALIQRLRRLPQRAQKTAV